MCELLLENEADVDHCDNSGRSPLWAAASMGHAPVVALLLFWGCAIDTMDSEGRTVLSVAAAQGTVCINCKRCLLKYLIFCHMTNKHTECNFYSDR